MDSGKQPLSNKLSPLFDVKISVGLEDQEASHSKLSRPERDATKSLIEEQAKESSFTFHPENVVNKNSGILLVKPPHEFLQNACDYWKSSCLGYFDKNVIPITDETKDALIEKYHKVGLTNVYFHQLGYLVLKFDNPQSASKAIDCSPLYIDGHKIHVHKWFEHFHTVYPLKKENVWIEISNIPFSYWSVEGLCYICSAIGRPIAFHRQTLLNAKNKSPSDKALVCVEIGVGASRPSVLMTVIPGHSDKFMARVNIVYLDSPDSCLMCLSVDHSTEACEDVVDLVPFTYDSSREGKDIFKSQKENLSDDDNSYDILFVGASKGGEETEAKSSRDHDEGGSKSKYVITLSNSTDHASRLAGDQGHQEASNEEKVDLSDQLQGQAKGKLVADEGGSEGTHSRVVVVGLPAKPVQYFQRYYVRREKKRQMEQLEIEKGAEEAAAGSHSQDVDSRCVLLDATQDGGKKRTKCEAQQLN